MATLQKKSFSTPDEVRTPPKTRLEMVTYNGMSVVRVTYQPGWKWSEHIKPVVGTESCQIPLCWLRAPCQACMDERHHDVEAHPTS